MHQPASNQPPCKAQPHPYRPSRYHAEDAPCTAVFVRDFPADVTPEKLEEAFTRFGAVKNGVKGVNLKTQRGKDSFAFVEFEEASAVPAAIEGQVLIGGQQVSSFDALEFFLCIIVWASCPGVLQSPGQLGRQLWS